MSDRGGADYAGKAHKPYEFGSKVSVARTKDSKIMVAALAFEGNPYDGDTLPETLNHIKALTGKRPKLATVDRGIEDEPAMASRGFWFPKRQKRRIPHSNESK